MIVVYAREPFPEKVTKAIFLAGPTPRSKDVASWRPGAIQLLHELGYDGHVFTPEDRNGEFAEGEYENQIEWENEGLHRADAIVFWIPRNMATMPALTTNVEWGLWADTGKSVLGTPRGAEKVRYLQAMAEKFKVPSCDTLEGTLRAAMDRIGPGSPREGGESHVPLHVWNTPTFQAWYKAQRDAGNRLDGARVLWTFRVGPKRNNVFAWCIHVNVYVASEGRNKENEFVLGRSDISSVVLYTRPPPYKTGGTSFLYDTEVVLVREFRSPGRTAPGGFVYDLPGGSSKDGLADPLDLAVSEVHEETGFKIDPSRLKCIGTLQLAATLCAHASTVYIAPLAREEMDALKAQAGQSFGVAEDTERTYVEVRTIGDMMKNDLVDWSTFGMIMAAILNDG